MNPHKNKYLNYSIDQFLQGGNKSFHYRKEAIYRIVNYVIALESLFLIDSSRWFLRQTLAKRVSTFLSDAKAGVIIKFMYDERSNIVHGNNIDLDEKQETKLVEKLKKHMIPFETLIRTVYIKMLNMQFDTKNELEKSMKRLFDLPKQVVKIMNDAKKESEKLI